MTEQTRRATRLLEVERLLRGRPHGWTSRELAQRLECTTRTIQRDLAVIESELNTPLVQDGSRYRILEGAAPLAPLRFTIQEARALLLASRLYFKNAVESDADGQSALEKLAGVLPPAASQAVRLTNRELLARPRAELHTRVFRTLTDAWAAARKAVIEYRSHDDMSFRTTILSPYLIEPGGRGTTYVIGASSAHPQNVVRTFKVERIRSAELTAETFSVPEDIVSELVTKLSSSWSVVFTDDVHEVAVDFTSAVADRVAETQWHPSQKLQALPDGGVRLTVRLPHLMEFIPWIRTWGPEALVVEPESLRDEVADSLIAAADRYREAPHQGAR